MGHILQAMELYMERKKLRVLLVPTDLGIWGKARLAGWSSFSFGKPLS